MNNNEFKEALTRLEELDRSIDKLMDALGLRPESILFESFNKLADMYMKALAELVGDKGEWIDWFVLEDDYGKKGMEAGYDNNLKKIKSIDDLINLINESKRGDK